jgi:enoyl-CoA hydratase
VTVRRTQADLVAEAFARDDVDGVLASLDAAGTDFAAKAAASMRRGSPASVAVSLELIRRARDLDLDGVLRTDFRLVTRLLAPPTAPGGAYGDFYEGVRAAIVDKDRDPKWHPAPDANAVADLFADLPADAELAL